MTVCNTRFLTTVKPLTTTPRGGRGESAWQFSKRQMLLVSPVKHIIKEVCWSNRRGEQMLLAIKAYAKSSWEAYCETYGGNFPCGRTKETQQVNSGKNLLQGAHYQAAEKLQKPENWIWGGRGSRHPADTITETFQKLLGVSVQEQQMGEVWGWKGRSGLPACAKEHPAARLCRSPLRSHQHLLGPSCICHGPHAAALPLCTPTMLAKAVLSIPDGGPHFLLPCAPWLFFSPCTASPVPVPPGSPPVLSHAGGIVPYIPQPMSQHSPFAGEGEGWYKVCNEAWCPLHVPGVNFQRSWSFTVGTRLCFLSRVSSFQAKPHTRSGAFPQLHTWSTFHTVPGSAGPGTATHMASSFLLQASRSLCNVGLCSKWWWVPAAGHAQGHPSRSPPSPWEPAPSPAAVQHGSVLPQPWSLPGKLPSSQAAPGKGEPGAWKAPNPLIPAAALTLGLLSLAEGSESLLKSQSITRIIVHP